MGSVSLQMHPDDWIGLLGSDVVHYRILGTHVVILNSARATKDLFERRSGLYSDRYATLSCLEGCYVDHLVKASDSHARVVRPSMNICIEEMTSHTCHRIGLNRVWGFLGYGDRWRAHRKLFHQYFRDSEIPNYYPQMRKSVHQLLGLLCDSPQNLFDKLSL